MPVTTPSLFTLIDRRHGGCLFLFRGRPIRPNLTSAILMAALISEAIIEINRATPDIKSSYVPGDTA